ncbi:MAG: SGNH/GDSL hydrolase family protein [Bacteroidales bacterium]|nr:SGNH/GDSL hydrolase family protein [Bacteroidales bacterium]
MMKYTIQTLVVIAVSFLSIFSADAQEAKNYYYTDASVFPIYGKAIENTSATYERLPASLEGVTRPSVWNLAHHSAGISVRFRSDSPSIKLRWISFGLATMNHMTDTGTRGLDLYTQDPVDGHWRFARSARPQKDTLNDQVVISGMEPKMREFIVYLSLYEGVKKLEIGVEEGSVIDQPALDSPRKGSPIVMYGTSILQGGCANRPGMAFTNIISRELDREVVNLGFSGNARLDYEIAELMAAVKDPSLFVLDNVPNCEASLIDERQEKFFRIIRDAHPDVPVVFVENPAYPHTVFDKRSAADVAARNASMRAVYEKLKKAGEKRIYYIKGDKMIGTDGEATVDGVHFTDLGMVRYTEYVLPTLKKALRKK